MKKGVEAGCKQGRWVAGPGRLWGMKLCKGQQKGHGHNKLEVGNGDSIWAGCR